MSKLASFNALGSIGVSQDPDSTLLPADDQNGFAWSGMANFRTQAGSVAKIPGYASVFDTTIQPWYVSQVMDGDTPVYFYMSGTQIYLFKNSTHYNMTRILTGYSTVNVGGNKTGGDLPFAANKATVVVDVGGGKTGGSSTGWLNNATVHLGNLNIDGTDYPIAITGSAALTYTNLISQINTDIGAVATASLDGNGNLLFTCDVSTANATTMVLTDTGSGTTRSWALLTGYVSIGTATTHNLTATVTIDGGSPQALATQSLQHANYTALIAGLDSQFTGGPLTLTGGNLRITTNSALRTGSVSISDTNLFSSLTGYTSITNTATADIPYTTSTLNDWQTALLNNLPVFNNGSDDPQYWPSPRAVTTMLLPLQNWVTGTKCAVMKAFKAYLIAMDITTPAGVREPTKVKWSGAALPGALPTTWDITDVTADAGEQSLSDTLDAIIDGLQLGDSFLLYKKRSTYRMSYVGGSKIFSIQSLFVDSGILARDCAVQVGNQHFVVTPEDIIMHNGSEIKSLVDGNNRTWFFNQINQAYAYRVKCVVNYLKTEVWICYPSTTSQNIDSAFIYNYRTNTWSKRQLPSIYSMFSTTLDIGAAPTYNSFSTELIGSADRIIDYQSGGAATRRLFAGIPGLSKVCVFDSDNTDTDNSVPMAAMVERTNLPLEPEELVKTVKRVWLRASSRNATPAPIQVYVGHAMRKTDSITWDGPFPFSILSDSYICCFSTGRYISVRFKTSVDTDWTLQGFDLEYDIRGRW
jgi:hypothetical protein